MSMIEGLGIGVSVLIVVSLVICAIALHFDKIERKQSKQ